MRVLEPAEAGHDATEVLRDERDGEQAGEQCEHKHEEHGTTAQPEEVVAEERIGGAGILLSFEDDVDVALWHAFLQHGCGTEDAAHAGGPGIIALDQPLRLRCIDEVAHRSHVHVIQLHDTIQRDVLQDATRGIEQIDLDARIHRHHGMHERADRLLRDLAVEEWFHLIHGVLREVVVQALGHLERMVVRCIDMDPQRHAREQQQDDQESRGYPPEKAGGPMWCVAHGRSGSSTKR